MGGAVNKEKSVLESTRRGTITISEFHPNDIECHFRTCWGFAFSASLDIDDIADRQDRF